MKTIKVINTGLSFLLELLALAIFGYFGYQLNLPGWGRVIAAVIIPLVVAILWGIFAAPNSSTRLKGLRLLVFKTVVFGAAVLVLYYVDYPSLAIIMFVIVVVNLALEFFVD